MLLKKKLKKLEESLLNVINLIEKSSAKSYELWEKLGDIFPTTFANSSNNFASNFSLEINEQISSGNGTNFKSVQNISYQICNKTIRSFGELKYLLINELDNLMMQRENLLVELSEFFEIESSNTIRHLKTKKHSGITDEMVREAADCHLRNQLLNSNNIRKQAARTAANKLKCSLCKSDKVLKDYAKCLFSNSDDALKLVKKSNQMFDKIDPNTDNPADEDDENGDTDSNELENYQVQLSSRSDLEKLIKLINSIVRKDDSNFFKILFY